MLDYRCERFLLALVPCPAPVDELEPVGPWRRSSRRLRTVLTTNAPNRPTGTPISPTAIAIGTVPATAVPAAAMPMAAPTFAPMAAPVPAPTTAPVVSMAESFISGSCLACRGPSWRRLQVGSDGALLGCDGRRVVGNHPARLPPARFRRSLLRCGPPGARFRNRRRGGARLQLGAVAGPARRGRVAGAPGAPPAPARGRIAEI